MNVTEVSTKSILPNIKSRLLVLVHLSTKLDYNSSDYL